MHWTYSSGGLPLQVARSVRGKPSLQASRRFVDGRLVGRTAQVHLGVGGVTAQFDDCDAPTGSAGAGNCYGCGNSGAKAGETAWADAMPTPRKGC